MQAAQQYALPDGVNWELVAQVVNNSTQLPNRTRSARMCEERCVCVRASISVVLHQSTALKPLHTQI